MSSNYSLIDQGIVSLPRIIYSHDRDSTAPAPTSNSVSAAAATPPAAASANQWIYPSISLPRLSRVEDNLSLSQVENDNYFLNRMRLYQSPASVSAATQNIAEGNILGGSNSLFVSSADEKAAGSSSLFVSGADEKAAASASTSQFTPFPRFSELATTSWADIMDAYDESASTSQFTPFPRFSELATTSWADIMDAYDESTFCKGTAINSKWITNDCPITCEPLTIKTAYRLTCGHSCDRSSLYTWWESSSTGRTCPLCRAIEPPCPCSVCPPTKPRCSCGQYH